MKSIAIPLVAATLIFAGCEYKAPLTSQHNIPIDPTVLGHWQIANGTDDTGSDQSEDMLVLRFSDTEYLIHYPTGDDGMYFRGYLIKIGNVSCVQLQIIGTADGSIPPEEEALFHVASFKLVNDTLEVKLLNSQLVDKDLNGSEALVKAFLEHQSDPELFENPGLFKRIKAD